jgi:hypothetical protein
MKFQGRLTDSQGRPITGTPQVSFEIYDSASGGTLLWGPSAFQNVNANDAGLFSTEIGPFTTLSIFSGAQDLYLQVTIKAGTAQTNQVLSPRQRLDTVAFSFHATQADKASTADTVPDGSITAAKIQQGSIGSDQITDHSVEPVDLSTTIASQFIPSGMISMFASACPAGWTRFTPLDNRFPLGAGSYTGNPGGSSAITGLTTGSAGAHSHTIPPHQHDAGSLVASGPVPLGSVQFRSGGTSESANRISSLSLPVSGQTAQSAPQTSSTNGDHTHPVVSDGSWLPPYLGVVYCEKD